VLECDVLEHGVIESYIFMLEEKDFDTAGYSKCIAFYASTIAIALSLSKEEQNITHQASMLHDIWKILTPESILLKPKKLTKKKYKIIQKHAENSKLILKSIMCSYLYLFIIRHHHEYFKRAKAIQMDYKEMKFHLLHAFYA